MRVLSVRPIALLVVAASLLFVHRDARADVVNFEDLALAPNSYWNGPDLGGTQEPDPYGGSLPVYVGSFQSGGASFVNRYNANYGNWSGFAYSNVNNPTNPSYTNQFAAVTGTGRGGSGNYAIGTGYHDLTANDSGNDPFDPGNPDHLNGLPFFQKPNGTTIEGMYVTNATYAYFSMLQGDPFSGPKFGGLDGNAADWLKLTAYGTNSAGDLLASTVEFYLADFRFSDNSLDYIVKDWRYMDLSPLQDADKIFFNISGSRVGEFGLSTPAYFAMDDLVVRSVPEPASLVALLIGSSVTFVTYRRRRSA